MSSAEPTFGFLLHDVARLMRLRFDRKAQKLGLTRAQWQVLAHLRFNDGIQQSQLAALLEIQPITLVRLLDRLQKASWIERRDDATDRRVKRIFLTAKAKPVITKLKDIGQDVRDHAAQGISTASQAQMMRMLLQMRGNLIERGE